MVVKTPVASLASQSHSDLKQKAAKERKAKLNATKERKRLRKQRKFPWEGMLQRKASLKGMAKLKREWKRRLAQSDKDKKSKVEKK